LVSLDDINKGFKQIGLQYMDDNSPTPLEPSCLVIGSFKQKFSGKSASPLTIL